MRTRRLNARAIGVLVFFLGLGSQASGQSGMNPAAAGNGVTVQNEIPQPTDFDGWKSRGTALVLSGKFQQAADALEIASNLKPNDSGARLYLGFAYMVLSFGAKPPGNAANVARALTQFKRVLEADAENTMALAALAAMSYRESTALQGSEKLSKLHEARDWNRRVISADPMNQQAYLLLGAIAATEYLPVWREARAADGLKPLDAGPLRNAASRTKLLSQYGPLLEDGIANLRAAIKIDPQYASALDYASVLIRERADLRDTPDQYSRDIAEANALLQRAVGVWSAKPRPQPAPGSRADWFEGLTQVLGPPPPPPPPPPMPPTIGRIEITGVHEKIAEMLRDRLRVRVGDPASPEMIGRVTAEIRQIDEHSRVNVTLGPDGPPFTGGAILHIAVSSFAFPLGPDSVTYEPLPDPTGKRILLDPKVAATNIVTRVNPTYPALARQAHVQGEVQLVATVGTDGRLLNLQVVSGNALLVPAALAAVKQWVFKPAVVNGNAVEADTPITLKFTLTPP